MRINNLVGGKILGEGTYGIVLSNPRIPFVNENYENIMNLSEVSKIYPNMNTYDNEYNSYKNFIEIFGNQQDYFMMPIRFGKINVNLFNSLPNIYSLKWSDDKIIKITKNIRSENHYFDKQITFNKGKEFENIEPEIFLSKFLNICIGVRLIHSKNIICGDIKLTNIVLYENKLKIIDFSSIININEISTIEYKHKPIISSYIYYIHPTFICIYIGSILLPEPDENTINFITYNITLDTDTLLITKIYNNCLELLKYYKIDDIDLFTYYADIYEVIINNDEYIIQKINNLLVSYKEALSSIFYDKLVKNNKFENIKNISNLDCSKIFKIFYKVIQFINDKNNSTNKIFKKIDLYSCAIILLYKLVKKDTKNIPIYIVKYYIKLASLFGTTFFVRKIQVDGNDDISNLKFYFIMQDTNYLINEYKIICCKLLEEINESKIKKLRFPEF